MTIGGVSLIFILGIINLILVVFQLLTGLHIIQVSMGIHKKSGILLFISALAHATLGILASL